MDRLQKTKEAIARRKTELRTQIAAEKRKKAAEKIINKKPR